MGEGVLELETAAADVLEVGAEETDGGGGGDGGAGFVDALLVDEDAAGEDEGLGAFAGGGVALVDEKLVETDLLRALFCGVRHSLVGALVESWESCLYLFMVAYDVTWEERMRRTFAHFRVKLHWYRFRRVKTER